MYVLRRSLPLVLLGVLACAPELLQPSGSEQCAPQHPSQTQWRSTPLFRRTLVQEPTPGPGAYGCLRITWGEKSSQALPVKMMPDGTVLQRNSDGSYPNKPIPLPPESRGQRRQLTLFLFGGAHQPPNDVQTAQFTTLCQRMLAQAYECKGAPSDECWVSMPILLGTQGDSDIGPCRVTINQTTPRPTAEPTTDAAGEGQIDRREPMANEPPRADEGQQEPIVPDTTPEQPPREAPVTDAGQPDRERCKEADSPRSCSTNRPGACQTGMQVCLPNGAWGECKATPDVEVCNNKDDDCDGQIDNNDACEPVPKCSPTPCMVILAGKVGQAGYKDGTSSESRLNRPVYATVYNGTRGNFPKGTIFVSDEKNYRIRQIFPNGRVATYAGGNNPQKFQLLGPRKAARFERPAGLVFGHKENLFVLDRSYSSRGKLRRILTDQNLKETEQKVENIPHKDIKQPVAIAYQKTSKRELIYVGDHQKVLFAYDGQTITAHKANYDTITSLAFLPDGKLLVTLVFESIIRAYSTTAYKELLDFAGKRSDAGDADGTKSEARFDDPRSVAVASSGHVYVYEKSTPRIREIDTKGNVTTKTKLQGLGNNSIAQIAIDVDQNLIIVDTDNHVIRKLYLK